MSKDCDQTRQVTAYLPTLKAVLVQMHKVSDGDRLRIAIALTALKFKPHNQSLASYVLDLRERFAPSRAGPPFSADASWRDRALALERDFAVLQAQYEAEQIKTLACASSASAPGSSAEQPQPASSSKKKVKKKAGGAETRVAELSQSGPHRVDLKTILEGLQHDRTKISLPGPKSLFPALEAFLQLTSLSEVQPVLLRSTTLRVLKASANVLTPVLSTATPKIASDVTLLATLGVLIYQILSTALPLLTPTPPTKRKVKLTAETLLQTSEGLNDVLGTLCGLILRPIIQSFAPLSQTFLETLFVSRPISASGRKGAAKSAARESPVDIRADVISLFRAVFGLVGELGKLSALSGLCRSVRSALALEAIRELERLLFGGVDLVDHGHPGEVEGTVGAEDGDGSTGRAAIIGRVRKLADKDALWYLCDILHVLFDTSSGMGGNGRVYVGFATVGKEENGGGDEGADVMLEEAVLEAMFRFVTRCKYTEGGDGKAGLDGGRRNGKYGRNVERDGSQEQGQKRATERDSDHGEGSLSSIEYVEEDIAGGGTDGREGHEGGGRDLPGRERETRKEYIDEVGYGMVLGVVERYWLASLDS